MPVQGTPAFDAVTLLDIDAISFASAAPSLTGHAAFVNMKTGNTYGETSVHSRWSKDTMEALAHLKDCMEQDIAEVVFVTDSASPTAFGSLASKPPEGIGEHATTANEAPSV